MASINKPSQPLVPAEIDPVVLDGKADLVNGEVPSSQLPSYVDDVIEFANSTAFPEEGESGKIYVALDTNFTYRWTGSVYTQVGGGETDLTDYYNKSKIDKTVQEIHSQIDEVSDIATPLIVDLPSMADPNFPIPSLPEGYTFKMGGTVNSLIAPLIGRKPFNCRILISDSQLIPLNIISNKLGGSLGAIGISQEDGTVYSVQFEDVKESLRFTVVSIDAQVFFNIAPQTEKTLSVKFFSAYQGESEEMGPESPGFEPLNNVISISGYGSVEDSGSEDRNTMVCNYDIPQAYAALLMTKTAYNDLLNSTDYPTALRILTANGAISDTTIEAVTLRLMTNCHRVIQHPTEEYLGPDEWQHLVYVGLIPVADELRWIGIIFDISEQGINSSIVDTNIAITALDAVDEKLANNYYTKSEVDNAITVAIGNILNTDF